MIIVTVKIVSNNCSCEIGGNIMLLKPEAHESILKPFQISWFYSECITLIQCTERWYIYFFQLFGFKNNYIYPVCIPHVETKLVFMLSSQSSKWTMWIAFAIVT